MHWTFWGILEWVSGDIMKNNNSHYLMNQMVLGNLVNMRKNFSLSMFKVTVTLMILLSSMNIFAAAKRCDLVGKDTTTSGGVRFKKCLDLSDLNGKTIVIPSNITRIDNDGLSLCKGAVSGSGSADIGFAVDQSGSMKPIYGWIDVAKNDTIYYEINPGCASKTTNGTITIQGASPLGPQTVLKLVDSTGCKEFAGDPYSKRADAVKKAMVYMASISPNSTAGYYGFASGPGSAGVAQPLLQLNTAAKLQQDTAAVKILDAGGTSYNPPLSAINGWLNDINLKKNTNQAIVLISDGKPGDSAIYTPTLVNMPKIYTIYLGKSSNLAGYAKLQSIANVTGGTFTIIPADQPDSLASVIKNILKTVLQSYTPANLTVTNTTIGQSAFNSTPANFVPQADGSWLVKLNDIVALSPSTGNSIKVVSNFKETGTSTLDTTSSIFTISTTGTPDSVNHSILGSQFGIVCYDKSAIRILNNASIRPPYLTENDLNYRLRIRTTPIDLTILNANSKTQIKLDNEAPVLGAPVTNTDSIVYGGLFNFKVGAATNLNGTLESSPYDFLIANWTHPRDAQDFAADTLAIKASQKISTMIFTQSDFVTPPTNGQYSSTQTFAYIKVTDQEKDPSKSYTVTFTDNLGDLETVTLTPTAVTGVFTGQIPMEIFATTSPNNGKIQFSASGDQLHAIYIDPVYGDTAIANVGIGQDVQEAGVLNFTDENGVILAPNALWNPSKGKVYVTYADDYVSGTIANKDIALVINNKKYGATRDQDIEHFIINLKLPHNSGPGIWTGEINLSDIFPAKDSNSVLETNFRGELTASVFPHDNVGKIQSIPATASLLIAYPDAVASLSYEVVDSTKGSPFVKTSEGWRITVKDQSFTNSASDTVLVSMKCLINGDSVSGINAIENGSGNYVTGWVEKNEGAPNLSDKILSCASADNISITYVDPVYGTTGQLLINEVAKPVANPPAQQFVSKVDVVLTSTTTNALIYYTLDGSMPDTTKTLYKGTITITKNTTIKAIAVKAGWKNSKVMTEVYIKQFTLSKLTITPLDTNGNIVAGKFLTQLTKTYKVNLTTTEAGFNQLSPTAIMKRSNDHETLNLFINQQNGNGILFSNVQNFVIGSATNQNSITESSLFDTLIVSWVNPNDANDHAEDTVYVHPGFQQAQVYFSNSIGGTPISQYPSNQDTVYVNIDDQPGDSRLPYTVKVTSNKHNPIDEEILTLTEISPGHFSAKIPVTANAFQPGNNALEVSRAGDQLQAIFVDPVYFDTSIGSAGFAEGVQEVARIDFIDTLGGSVLAPDVVWNPEKANIYLRYSDDWSISVNAVLQQKSISLILQQKKYSQILAIDTETVKLNLISHNATRGIWEGSFPLKDANPPRKNDTSDTYYRGELNANAQAHDNAGVAENTSVGDLLVIAYPNQTADIVLEDSVNKTIERLTDKLIITIHDQIFTHVGNPTILAQISCAATGDIIDNVEMAWDASKSAYVTTKAIIKTEQLTGQPNTSDNFLACSETDIVKVVYIDPVYGNSNEIKAQYFGDKVPSLIFASSLDSTKVTSRNEKIDKDFLVIVEAKSPTRDQIDIIKVVVTGPFDELDTLLAVETASFSGKFVVRVPFKFVTAMPTPNNDSIEAKLDITSNKNSAFIKAKVIIGANTITADLTLFAQFNLVVHAYIKDENKNARGDKVYFVFDHSLSSLPKSLDAVYWNQVDAKFKKIVGPSQISFAGKDSSVIVADFTQSEFGQDLTGIPEGVENPYALFPDNALFGAQKHNIDDSMGPVMLTAKKLPSDLIAYQVSENQKRFSPDTLLIKVSEKLITGPGNNSWKTLFRFSKGCSDYAHTAPVLVLGEPKLDSNNTYFKVLVDNTPGAITPLIGDCIFLTIDGSYTDAPGNLPLPIGVELTGANPAQIVRSFRNFPPVAGLDVNDPKFLIATHDPANNVPGETYKTQDPGKLGKLLFVPPVGFDAKTGKWITNYVPESVNDSTRASYNEVASFEDFESTKYSAVEVVASSEYIAHVSIFDHHGLFMQSFVQSFGYNGEMKNPNRSMQGGLVSWLVWDLKDSHGALSGNGVYVWKVLFQFKGSKDGKSKQEIKYTKMGRLRPQ